MLISLGLVRHRLGRRSLALDLPCLPNPVVLLHRLHRCIMLRHFLHQFHLQLLFHMHIVIKWATSTISMHLVHHHLEAQHHQCFLVHVVHCHLHQLVLCRIKDRLHLLQCSGLLHQLILVHRQ